MNIEKLIRRTAVIVGLLCLVGVASISKAQAAGRVTPCSATTPNNAICITWTHDGKTTDGVAISGVTFRVAQKIGSGSYSNVATALTGNQYYAQNLAVGSYTFQVFASCASCTAESDPSNAATGSATQVPVVPSSPIIVIAATINANGPPTYKVIQRYTLKPNEVVFVVPSSQLPLFASR